jgi:predicted small lipoprotein YifL
MRRQILAVTAFGVMMAIGLAACDDKGPMQKTGEKLDRATDQDKLIGKGPVEKAGKNVDDAVKDLKK